MPSTVEVKVVDIGGCGGNQQGGTRLLASQLDCRRDQRARLA